MIHEDCSPHPPLIQMLTPLQAAFRKLVPPDSTCLPIFQSVSQPCFTHSTMRLECAIQAGFSLEACCMLHCAERTREDSRTTCTMLPLRTAAKSNLQYKTRSPSRVLGIRCRPVWRCIPPQLYRPLPFFFTLLVVAPFTIPTTGAH